MADANAIKILKDNIAQALREDATLSALHADWGADPETAGGHVFKGVRDEFAGARNRGRMPFLEFEVNNAVFNDNTNSGGLASAFLTIRGRGNNDVGNTGVDTFQTMMLNAGKAIRISKFDSTNDYDLENGTAIYEQSDIQGPSVKHFKGGLYGDITMKILFSYDKDTLK